MKKLIIDLIRRASVIVLKTRLQASLLHILLLALVEYLGQDSKQSIVVKI